MGTDRFPRVVVEFRHHCVRPVENKEVNNHVINVVPRYSKPCKRNLREKPIFASLPLTPRRYFYAPKRWRSNDSARCEFKTRAYCERKASNSTRAKRRFTCRAHALVVR